jgi:hypothetical protein
MVKKILIPLALIILFILSIMYFSPKENIYFLLEHELKKYDVIISNEEFKDAGLKVELNDAELYYKSINTANVKEIHMKIFVFYNSIILSNITLSQMTNSFLPAKIEKLILTYSIFNHLNINIYENGDNGEVSGSLSLMDMALHISFKPSELMLKKYKNSLREFKKLEDGEYSYDRSF